MPSLVPIAKLFCLVKDETDHRSRKFNNSLPNDKILDWTKLKPFADDK